MKKSLIALAVLAAAGAASAQSSVTLFGIVDVGVERLQADTTAGKQKLTQVRSGAESTSRIGLRGTEDLGGGLSASFWLEAQIQGDDGTGTATSSTNRTLPAFSATSGANAPVRSGTQGLTFNRRSTVSLAGGFGELRLGRDYVPAFWNQTVFDPFGTVGAGSHLNISQALGNAASVQTVTRASNSIGYFLPGNLGGFYGQAMYARGEVPTPAAAVSATGSPQAGDGNLWSARLGYAAGPLNVAYGYGRTNATGANNLFVNGSNAAALGIVTPIVVTDGKYTNQNIGASYDFGVAKISTVYNQEKIENSLGSLKHKSWLLGGSVPVGAGVIKASYISGKADNSVIKGNQLALGYVHNLSKRTAVYTTYSRLANKGTINAYTISGVTPSGTNPKVSGFDIGLRHSF